ncbi:hypothetical protein MF271_21985 (plasmid) [Deinococcus sp. KNUC1210]|uniref:hypothetical protein n=1 Tax=Deinococcus sp. KNUC1210 TaxID=2917691 RepID=UPI001EF080B8|nr:hypothetical protein [Deinococcus sp. KNUC1210]ULH18150.1 hypothetical protein MF271_21985 [Deinococcus sp. KNUC1210]
MTTLLERTGPGQGVTSPLPSFLPWQLTGLSTGAQQLGQLNDVEARVLLGDSTPAMFQELMAIWWIVEVPGRSGRRVGRVTTYLAVPQGNVPDLEVTEHDALVLRGCSGMLSFFAQKLQLDAGQALAAMRALVVCGYASGGPVGASFAFRVFDTT